MVAGVELTYNTSASAMQMAQTIFGDGVTVTSASYTGATGSSAIYSNGQLSTGVVPSTTGVILSTGNAASFTTTNWYQSNTSTSTSTNTSGVDNNTQFNQVAGATTYDAAWLDVNFIPTGNVMTIQFVFSSEEFPEYSGTIYNDTVGVWINGQVVPLSVGDGDVAVGNINQTENSNLFVSNTGDQYNTEMDGFTVTMTLTIPVNPGVVNSIKIGIADVADTQYDSNLLIAADSVQTTLVALDDNFTMPAGGTRTFDLLANDVNNTSGTLKITHINGVAVSVGSTVTLGTGQVIQLNADGTITVLNDADVEEFSFTYKVESLSGSGAVLQNDTGFVKINSVPCFVAGTMILTPDGEVPVESLEPGDLVMTLDDGPQPLCWIGRREVAAEGSFAPIRIRAGTFGNHRALTLSPQHRIMVRDSLAELLFGEGEVLVKAKDLVNGSSIRRLEGGTVEYVHILFDKHQVVFSEGLASESFQPGPETTKGFDPEVLAELVAIFPELDTQTGSGYGPSARRTLKPFEAKVLIRNVNAA